jgi:hypothetical protein
MKPMGRPPTYGKARSSAQLQREYYAQRQHETAQVARALLAVLVAFPDARPLAASDDVRRGMAFLLRADVTGAVARFERLIDGAAPSPPPQDPMNAAPKGAPGRQRGPGRVSRAGRPGNAHMPHLLAPPRGQGAA